MPSQTASAEAPAPKTIKRKAEQGPAPALVKQLVAADEPPTVRLAILAILFGGPMTLPQVREAAGLTDREAVQALDYCRHSGLLVRDGGHYSLPEKK